MPSATETDAQNPDRDALVRVGEQVRRRLASDPTVYRIETDKAEIFAVTNFLDTVECERLMRLIDEVAKPSPTYDAGNVETYRTSYSGDIDQADSNVRMMERRICDLLGLDEQCAETLQGQRYEEGQEFRGHYDWFDTSAFYWPHEAETGGQRSWTAMAYLNEVESGGDTEFPNLHMSFPPQPGTLLLWNNMRPDGSPNPDVLHAGTPVIQGVKYVVTKWFRTREWG